MAQYIIESGYLEEVKSVDVHGPHTLDLEKYTIQNLWQNFSNDIGEAEQFIATDMGPDEIIAWVKDECYEMAWQKSNRFNFSGLFNSTGALTILVSNLGGYESLVKLQLLVRAATGHSPTFLTVKKKTNVCNKYDKIFGDLESPDLVIYGYANTIISNILRLSSSENLQNVPSGLVSYLECGKNWVGRLGASRPLYVLRTKESKTIWMVSHVYGEDTALLFQSIVARRPKEILITGIAGAIKDKFKLGELVTPAYWLNSNVRLSLNWIHPLTGVSVMGTYLKVTTPLIETEDWLKAHSHVDIVDVEGGHILKVLENSGVKTSLVYIISDQVGVKGADRAQWNDEQRRPEITKHLCAFLHALRYNIESLTIDTLKMYNLFEDGGY